MHIKKNLIVMFGLASIALLGAGVAHAEDKGLGCGLGSKIAPKKTWISATTQGAVDYFLPPTFSMTSGTSGCAHHAIVNNDKEAIYYAEANFDRLEIEIPQGQGEYVSNFATVLGCDATAQGAMINALKNHYETLFPAQDRNADQMLRNVQSLIRSEPGLSHSCSANFVI